MTPEKNREAAREQARRLDFDPENMLVCLECGRTIVRKQSPMKPGHTDSVFCTCDPVGYPMHPVETDNPPMEAD